jgi:hypothetical protein
MNSFLPINIEAVEKITPFMEEARVGFCDFTPFVALMWQKMYGTEYAVCDSVLYLRFNDSDLPHFAVVSRDPVSHVDTLSRFSGGKPFVLSLVTDEGISRLEESGLRVECRSECSWGDYVYDGEAMRELKGKRFAGQRNHINKFESILPDWKYESITRDNVSHVAEFYSRIASESVTGNENRDYESDTVRRYFSIYPDFPISGGFVHSGGRIVSFAFGEVLHEMLFVHVEKADREVHGSYPMIVREFARANPAPLINREEDMGDEGLRTSKLSWHPIYILKKNCALITP